MRCSILVTVAGVTFRRGQGAVREAVLLVQEVQHRRLSSIEAERLQHSLRPRMVQPAYLGQQEAGRLVR